MTASPPRFEGTLDALYEQYIAPNVLSTDIVVDFHRVLIGYALAHDPLLLVRMVRDTERRRIYTTRDGTRFKATDNAPAWWIHAALFHEARFAASSFASVVESIPAHMFDMPPKLRTANASGWHIAHIFDVKDRNTDFASWRRHDVVARFVRNVHPCNYFLVPKTDWARWGGDERVIGYFAAIHAERYAAVWKEFVRVAAANEGKLARVHGPIRYAYGDSAPAAIPNRPIASADRGSSGRASYHATRLAFKAAVIEPLQDDDVFSVITPEGVFEMTKAEFRRVFANVVESASYRERGLYHYSAIPQKALAFLRRRSELDR